MQDATCGRIAPTHPQSTRPAGSPGVDNARARGDEPLNLHRVIAHAPSLLTPFQHLTQALRHAPATPPADRELVILRTAQLCDSPYVAAHHTAAADAAGLTVEQRQDLAGWLESGRFSERQRAILAYVDAMFGPDGVRDGVFAPLSRLLSDEEVVELTLTAAFYSGMARFADALQVPLEPGTPEGDSPLS